MLFEIYLSTFSFTVTAKTPFPVFRGKALHVFFVF